MSEPDGPDRPGPSVPVPEVSDRQAQAWPPEPPPRSAEPPRLATWIALALAIVGLVVPCFWLFPAPQVVAVILGHTFLARAGGNSSRGRNLAISALVLGYVGIALACVALAALLTGTFTPSTAE